MRLRVGTYSKLTQMMLNGSGENEDKKAAQGDSVELAIDILGEFLHRLEKKKQRKKVIKRGCQTLHHIMRGGLMSFSVCIPRKNRYLCLIHCIEERTHHKL